MSKQVVIVGGGVIGLCSAFFLHEAGCHVTVIDRSDIKSGTSHLNAGYICPSHFTPLASPGIIQQGLKWMLNSSSPFYIQPRFDPSLLRWLWAFKSSCNAELVKKNEPHLRDLCQFSQGLFQELSQHTHLDFHYEKKGLLMLCQSKQALEHELHILRRAKSLGVNAKEITPADLKQMEPKVVIDALGGVYFPDDHHATPTPFMNALHHYLKSAGVQFLLNEKVIDFTFKSEKIISISTTNQHIKADEFVVASGTWSAQLLKKLNLKLLLQPGKGYAFESKRISEISTPTILVEAKTAVTPMLGFTRFAGTMELSGISNEINKKRVDAIAKAVHRFYPELSLNPDETSKAKFGYRPLSPDGMPYIGRSNAFKNLTIATGHAMIGWTLGPGTGKLVSELILGQKLSVGIHPYNPNRIF